MHLDALRAQKTRLVATHVVSFRFSILFGFCCSANLGFLGANAPLVPPPSPGYAYDGLTRRHICIV